ncbi:50S ribosomal protein L11 methyltransferase [Synergistes jonesii]|uniref:50S ribosomal protein L11 methyltransferase n=1 Tax=Synergistes jonesii TaxID=2754 RepID=UPI00242CFE5B|nr:50S ribosomal protein L11 methyltransferase [Synergistes jonesii]
MRNNDNYWWYITIKADSSQEDNLFSIADISGSIGTEMQELPNGALRLRVYYRSSEEIGAWRERLLAVMKAFPGVEVEDWGKIENQPWNVAAEEAFPPLPVGGRLVVLAPWHRGSEPAGRVALYINPGSAFGTGYHESTQIALELLEKYIREGCITADIGTGSGILTVGALKMGAKFAYARDIDPTVIEEARKNFELNELDPQKIDLDTGDLLKDFGRRADILTANILLGPLTTMLADVPAAIGGEGVAIFSGMLEKEKPVFLSALAEAGMRPVEELAKGEWWGVAAKAQA